MYLIKLNVFYKFIFQSIESELKLFTYFAFTGKFFGILMSDTKVNPPTWSKETAAQMGPFVRA